MKILIIGGTGAIGIALTEILSQRGDEVVVTSRKNHESVKNVEFLQGNAHDLNFLKIALQKHYDAIVDFMVYTKQEFVERYEYLLKATDHYIFLSSSRVYAETDKITEQSPLLLDVCKDPIYLKTDEYALLKAREENILKGSKYKNWTIIRPYITYNTNRIQLGAYEKEQWLYRVLHGRSIVLSKDIVSKYTTMMYGGDVANILAQILCKKSSMTEVFNITHSNPLKWQEVLKVYCEVIYNETNNKLKVCWVENNDEIGNILKNKYQLSYDRLYNRVFDVSKIENYCEKPMEYLSMKKGLEMCLSEFLRGEKNFSYINWKWEAYQDRISREKTPLKEINSVKNKLKYLIYRYMPFGYKIFDD